MSIAEIADVLEGAPRQGASVDVPEGVRYVVLSDTALNRIARELRMAASARPDSEHLSAPEVR